MYSHQSEPLWQWTNTGKWIANGLALIAIIGFWWSLRYYDGREFLGLSQLKRQDRSADHHEALSISPMHRFVRHPWYFFALTIIWTRDMDPAFFMTTVMLTLYFVVGSRLEERKLVHYYGETYRAYQQRVPSLIPIPWRYIDRRSARELEKQSRSELE